MNPSAPQHTGPPISWGNLTDTAPRRLKHKRLLTAFFKKLLPLLLRLRYSCSSRRLPRRPLPDSERQAPRSGACQQHLRLPTDAPTSWTGASGSHTRASSNSRPASSPPGSAAPQSPHRPPSSAPAPPPAAGVPRPAPGPPPAPRLPFWAEPGPGRREPETNNSERARALGSEEPDMLPAEDRTAKGPRPEPGPGKGGEGGRGRASARRSKRGRQRCLGSVLRRPPPAAAAPKPRETFAPGRRRLRSHGGKTREKRRPRPTLQPLSY